MRVAVVLSTYDQPDWLRKTLWGYARQTYEDFELLVADDGSGPETRAVVEAAWTAYPDLALRHVWHPDRGYRKCVILNRATVATDADYLIFSDADCVPRRDYVASHARLATPGVFLSGGAVRLPLGLSQRLTEADVESGRAFDPGWLEKHGFDPGRHRLRFLEGTFWPTLLDALSPTSATWNGNNASTWRDTVIRANGFEEEMGYGGQDREFGERLANLGVQGLGVRHRAVLVHLDHGRPYKNMESILRNRELRRETIENGLVRARSGIEELQEEPEAFVASGPHTKGAA